MAYELLLLLAVLFFATFLFLVLFGNALQSPRHYFLQLWLVMATGGYFIWCWTHGGQTLAMKTWKLRLVAADGYPPGWRTALLRFLVAMPSVLTGFGIAWAFFDREGCLWHDRVAGTRLVLVDKQGAER
jgi:uncharacterized RDD family membrane protein YckC